MKFYFHTLNMHSYIESEESKQWFKDNLQTGVQLIGSENTSLVGPKNNPVG
ncbi:MAG: hypothetical protein NY202_03225 [Mollicutes bacterium UO1]